MRKLVMSDVIDTAPQTVKLDELSIELQQVINYEQVPKELYSMIISVHEVSEEYVRPVWDELPASAQNILDNFEQFHALISLSQCYAGLDFLTEVKDMVFDDMDEVALDNYKKDLLDKILKNCVKDVVKQLKKARLKPTMKREFRDIFKINA